MRSIPRPSAADWLALLALVGPVATVFAVRVMGTLLIVVAVLIGLTHVVRRQRLPAIDGPALAALIAILALGGLSTLWAPPDGYLAARLTKLALLFASGLVLFATAAAMTDDARARFRGALIAGAALGLAFLAVEVASDSALYRSMTATPFEDLEVYRVNRPLVLAALLFWPVATLLEERGWTGAAIAGGAFVALAGISATSSSQTAPVALLVGGAAWLVARVFPRTALVGLVGATILAIALAPWIGSTLAGLQGVADWSFLDAAAAGPRLDIWIRTAEVAAAHPFLGIGLEGLRLEAIAGTEPGAIAGYAGANHPHNAAIQIRLEFGTLGLILSTALLTALALRLLHAPTRALAAVVPLMAGIITVALVSHGLWQSWWIGTIAFLAAAARAVIGGGPRPAAA